MGCYLKAHLKMTVVDFVNDLQVTGQDRFQHAYWPPLQSFGKNRMVRVGASADSNIPSLVD